MKKMLVWEAQVKNLTDKTNDLTKKLAVSKQNYRDLKASLPKRKKVHEIVFTASNGPVEMTTALVNSACAELPDKKLTVRGKLYWAQYQQGKLERGQENFLCTGNKELIKLSLINKLAYWFNQRVVSVDVDVASYGEEIDFPVLPEVTTVPTEHYIIVPTTMDPDEIPDDLSQVRAFCKKAEDG